MTPEPQPPDRWYHYEIDDFEGYLKNLPLRVIPSSGLDVVVSTEGPEVIVWTPVATLGWFALLAIGVATIALGMAVWLLAFLSKEPVPHMVAIPIIVLLMGFGISLLACSLYQRLAWVTFRFDRSTGFMTAQSHLETLEVPLTSIESVEYMLGRSRHRSMSRKWMTAGNRWADTYQVNLVFRGMRRGRTWEIERKSGKRKAEIRRRRNLSACADGEYLKRRAEELAAFLSVPFVDAADRAEREQAIERILTDHYPALAGKLKTPDPSS